MRKALAVVLIVVVAAVGWWYASPLWTLREMREAARDRDAAKLSAYVDYPALRADLKEDLRRYVTSQTALLGDADGRGGFAAQLAGAFVSPVVDAAVTPEGISTMFAAQSAQPSNSRGDAQRRGVPMPVSAPEQPIIDREGIDSFKAYGKDPRKGALVFHRSGLGWKLVGVDLPVSGG